MAKRTVTKRRRRGSNSWNEYSWLTISTANEHQKIEILRSEEMHCVHP